MKITDVMIDRYGVWKDLLLPVNENGVTLIYGPNEAGKSTLMRFIRGVLYGFPATGLNRQENRAQGGTLRLLENGQPLEITRQIDSHGRQQFRATAHNRSLNETEFNTMLQDVDAEIYRTIYTLGLKELRELATLQTDQVDEFIYGTSLGLVGQKLMRAERKTNADAEALANLKNRGGQLFDLSGRYQSTQAAIAKSSNVIQRYEEELKRCQDLERRQQERRKRLDQLKLERNRAQFVQRVWKPWKRQRDLQAELDLLPEIIDFPSASLSKLDRLEGEMQAAKQRLQRLRKERAQLKQSLKAEKEHADLRDHASGIRALIDLKSLVESAERHLANVSADASMLKAELDEKLQVLGQDWTINRLSEVDTSPEAHLKLSSSARNYQTAVRRRARHRRRYQKFSDAHHQRQSEFHETLKRQKIQNVPQAIREAEQKLADLENLAQLRVREAEYEQRIRSAETQLEKLSLKQELPWWAQFMLTMFGMAGGFLIIAGLVKGVQDGWLIGTIYLLTGIMGGGLAWALRHHFENDEDETAFRLEEEIGTCEKELNEVRARISRLMGIKSHSTRIPADLQPRSRKSETDLIKQASQRLVELQEYARMEERFKKDRKKLSVQRGKMSDFQKDVSATRQAWCDLLKKLGLRETVRTSEAFSNWQHAVDAQQSLQQWQAAKDDVQRHQELLNQFREQMEMIAGRLSLSRSENSSLSQALQNWEKILLDYEKAHDRYLQLRREYRQITGRHRSAQEERDRLQTELRKLLRHADVSSIEEFRHRAKQWRRAEELRSLVADLNDQLNSLSREQPELALVEEDLLQYDSRSNQEQIEMLGLEIEDLESDLTGAQEELGRLRQTLATLENDASADDLRAQEARLLDQASLSTRDYQANRIASSALSRLMAEFENRFQPETLAKASRHLRKLTCGRYEEVRTILGNRELLIREKSGARRHVGELSDGTREQLFLAIRMALIEKFAEDGIEMPIVFDDLCVNFDQERTEAAVETLLDFATDRQVLFFTCHQHLANLFEEQDQEPIWLPALAQETPRLAG